MDERAKEAIAWASHQLKVEPSSIEAIGSDASHRRYFRLMLDTSSVIVMDAPPALEPVAPFIDIQKRLSQAQVHVPTIKAIDETNGWLVLSDLGRTSYLECLNTDNADALLGQAAQALIQIQTRAPTAGMCHYDAARLLAELNLFTDWFLAHHWHVTPTEDELDQWDWVCALLVRWALDQSQVFCHRDYMPRNLMRAEPNPGILDFQDAVIGPISYDIVSLYMDAFISWPRSRVNQWLEDYRQNAEQAGLEITQDPSLWLRTCDLMATQRHLKVIGIFARIAYRDGKPKYLQDTPRFFEYLKDSISNNPELAPLESLLTQWSARRKDL